MDYEKEYESSTIVGDEIIHSDPENDKISEPNLLEKGGKVTDLGEFMKMA